MHLSAHLAAGFAKATGQTPVTREIKLVGGRAVRRLLSEIRRGGRTSRGAKVRFR